MGIYMFFYSSIFYLLGEFLIAEMLLVF